MKFFLDTANVDEIRRAVEVGLCDGITTNPTIIAREGKAHKQAIQDIAKIVDGPISVEGVSMDADGIIKEAEEFVTWADNVVIKVPMTKEGMKAVGILEKRDIPTNVTLIFSQSQALIAAKAGATYVSPFVGRLDDIGQNGMDLVGQIVQTYQNYDFPTKVIVASVRSVRHVVEASLIGADIATIPAKVFEKMFHHELTDIGIKRFLEDHKKTPK